MKHVNFFKVDFSCESHLILPFFNLPEGAKVLRENDSYFIIYESYLYVVSDEREVDISSFENDRNIKHITYPSSGNINRRYLMKREREGETLNFLSPNLSDELSEFYENKTQFHADKELLENRRDMGEEFFISRKDNKIVSASYSTKGNRQLVSLATDKDFRNQNFASDLLAKINVPYLFCTEEWLRCFYEKRGYKVVRIYNTINR